MAQGTSIAVRTPPRPRKLEWMTSAIARPSSVSSATEATVKTIVCEIASRNAPSVSRLW